MNTQKQRINRGLNLNFIQNRFQNFKADKYQWGSCIFIFFFLAIYLFMWKDSGWRYEPLIRIVYCCLYPFVVFCFGQKAVPLVFMGVGFLAVQEITFLNFTYFWIILNVIFIFPKMKIASFIVYATDVAIVNYRRGDTVFHLILHFGLCVFIYLAQTKIIDCLIKKALNEFVKKSYSFTENSNPLILDDDERYIVDCLAKGMMMKEIEKFSKNTKTEKLKSAMAKNNCSKDELKMRYLLEINKSQ